MPNEIYSHETPRPYEAQLRPSTRRDQSVRDSSDRPVPQRDASSRPNDMPLDLAKSRDQSERHQRNGIERRRPIVTLWSQTRRNDQSKRNCTGAVRLRYDPTKSRDAEHNCSTYHIHALLNGPLRPDVAQRDEPSLNVATQRCDREIRPHRTKRPNGKENLNVQTAS